MTELNAYITGSDGVDHPDNQPQNGLGDCGCCTGADCTIKDKPTCADCAVEMFCDEIAIIIDRLIDTENAKFTQKIDVLTYDSDELIGFTVIIDSPESLVQHAELALGVKELERMREE